MTRLGCLLLPFLWIACLEPGLPPRGLRLVSGQDILEPGFITLGEETVVRFERHRAYAKGALGAVSDVWIVSLDGQNMRKVVSQRSDRGPTLQSFPAGSSFFQHFLVNEQMFDARTTVSTLIRLSPALEETLRIEGISRYFQGAAPSFPDLVLYEKPRKGETYQDLYLWDGTAHRYLGVDSGSGQIVFGSSGAIYAIFGEDRVFSRLPQPDGALTELYPNISQFTLSRDERYVVLKVSTNGISKELILELATGREIPFAKPNTGMWVGFEGDYFIYLVRKTATEPAEVRAIDVVGGTESMTPLPEPLVDVVSRIPRPASEETLVQDSLGQGVFVNSINGTFLRVFPGKLYSPKFTGDGQQMLYIDPQKPTLVDPQIHGPLMNVPSDLSAAPRLFSPPGTTTRTGFFDFTNGDRGEFLYFWVHLGRGTWDLYFYFFDTSELRLVTRSILQVTVSEHSIFGILNASQQDQSGDLVHRNLDTGAEVFYSHAVVNALVGGQTSADPQRKVLYLVRGRAPSAHDGLWLAPLLEPQSPDAGVAE